MGLYDAESEVELDDALLNSPDTYGGERNEAKMINLVLRRGTAWRELDRFLDTCKTEQFSKTDGKGWTGIKAHLRFCRKGKNNNGKTNTWVFNIGDKTNEFAQPDNPDPSASICLVGLAKCKRFQPKNVL